MTNTLLLVEDDPLTQLLFQVSIQEAYEGISIKTVNNGAQAKYYLEGKGTYVDRERYPLPVVILTDVSMPCVSGLDLLVWVKQHPELKHIPVIVMSSADDPEQVNLAMELGASSYFPKAMPVDHLLYQVKSVSSWSVSNYY